VAVRHDVAPLVAQKIFGEERSLEENVKQMIDFISKSLIPDVPNYVVDALWGHSTVTLQWGVMTELLLSEEADENLSERDSLILARLLNVCIKKATGHTICPKNKSDPEKHDRKVHIFFPCLPTCSNLLFLYCVHRM
jgi:hypothetical protein